MLPEHGCHVYGSSRNRAERRFVLHTEAIGGGTPKYVDIAFPGLIGLHAVCALPGSTLVDLHEAGFDEMLAAFREAQAYSKAHAWEDGWGTPIEYAAEEKAFINACRIPNAHGYVLRSSEGVPGWVLAVGIQCTERETKWTKEMP